MRAPNVRAKPCPACGTTPVITVRRGSEHRRSLFDNAKKYYVRANPDCPVCKVAACSGEMVDSDVRGRLITAWNRIIPVLARIAKLSDAGNPPAGKFGGCSAMKLSLRPLGDIYSYYEHEPAELDTLAGLSDDGAFIAEAFSRHAMATCSLLGRRCPRDVRSKGSIENMKCCLPAYADSHPADKLDDETLAAVAGMVGCLGCDALGKHWYLEECDQCNCGRVDAHLKCYYLAAEYRKRLESRKESAK